jgi:hypothetical protein
VLKTSNGTEKTFKLFNKEQKGADMNVAVQIVLPVIETVLSGAARATGR